MQHIQKKYILIFILSVFLNISVQADVKLPAIISDHMVLQKSPATAIWGTADPGEKITVSLNGNVASVQADKNGRWHLTMNLKDSTHGPFNMKIKGKTEITVKDVIVGEVWLASGQSNMQFILKGELTAAKEIPKSANEFIRHFKIQNIASLDPLEDCKGKWVIADPKTSWEFTAVGYFFAKMIHNKVKTPVGLINASWGGTHSESWTSVDALCALPEFKNSVKQKITAAKAYSPLKETFDISFNKWLVENKRMDRPSENIPSFTGESVDTSSWTRIKIPGPISGEGLPEAGVIWIRHDIDISEKNANKTLFIRPVAGEINGFESVYWNGKLIKQITFREFPGTPYYRRYRIQADAVKKGKNILAIRIYAPVGKPKVGGRVILAGQQHIEEDWLAKAEFSFPTLDKAELAKIPPPPPFPTLKQGNPGSLFNGMINPIVPYTIKGVIWYQGEGNATRAVQYQTAFPLLIKDWREQWNRPNMPFYFCQLANYKPKQKKPTDSYWAELREAQAMTLKLPDTAMAVLIDLGESNSVHPLNKKDVGERLAKIALTRNYNMKLPYSGPIHDAVSFENGKVRISFTHTDGGLIAKRLTSTYNVSLGHKNNNVSASVVRNSPDSELEGFAICGKDKKWIWANAKINGNAVIVWSDKIPEPIAVRYGWADNPIVNLYNGAGLPASPFRTDKFGELSRNRKF
jgi:sialate O-acetylesterase